MRDGPDTRTAIGPFGLKTMKVVPPHQTSTGTRHRCGIEWLSASHGMPSHERAAGESIVNHIPVQLAKSMFLGIKARIDLHSIAHRNIIGQAGVNGRAITMGASLLSV